MTAGTAQRDLRLGRHSFAPDQRLVMGIVNRTPDSFYDRGATWNEDAAMARVHAVVAEGADILDIGGVAAAPGAPVDVAEEIRRTVPFVAAARAAYPDLVISVDTWRHQVGREACQAGADLLNDTWGGQDPELPAVAAEFGAGLICAHAGDQAPRTRPFRVAYEDVMADVLDRTLAQASRATAAGVDPARILIDAAHDFGKNTWQSLEVTRRLGEMVATGWPVLVSLSNKDFIGETLDAPPDRRVTGTLATTAICAWLGARVFRVHQVPRPGKSWPWCRRSRVSGLPPGPSAGWPDATVITSAALCPGPPLLVRELTGADPVLPELRAACAGAVAALLRDRPAVVAVVGPGTATAPWPADGRLNVAAFGGPRVTTPVPAGPGGEGARPSRSCRSPRGSGLTCWTRRVTPGSG